MRWWTAWATAHVLLGIFGRGAKSARVVPNKLYQGMALGARFDHRRYAGGAGVFFARRASPGGAVRGCRSARRRGAPIARRSGVALVAGARRSGPRPPVLRAGGGGAALDGGRAGGAGMALAGGVMRRVDSIAAIALRVALVLVPCLRPVDGGGSTHRRAVSRRRSGSAFWCVGGRGPPSERRRTPE